jgi:hypothetical protein
VAPSSAVRCEAFEVGEVRRQSLLPSSSNVVSGEVKIEPVVNAANLTACPPDRVRQTPCYMLHRSTKNRTENPPAGRKTELHFEVQNHEAGDEIERSP